MKKFLCILIALIAVGAIAFVAFNMLDTGNTEPTTPLEDVVSASSPTKIVTMVTYLYLDGPLRSADLDGEYTLEIDGENAKFIYDYNVPAEAPVDGVFADNWIETKSGVLYFRDGKLSGDGENWDVVAPDSMKNGLNLVKNRFKTYVKSADEKTLTATFSADNAETVLGHGVSADGDITLVVTTDGVYMRSVVISYKTASGANVTINTSYSYNDITIDFSNAE